MAGCTKRQLLWRVLVPSARPLLMVGVNQVIMMALNMVIISSMIGAGGLGLDVLLALRALKVGAAVEAGISIVLLAIVLDRLSQAAAVRAASATVSGLRRGWWRDSSAAGGRDPRRHHRPQPLCPGTGEPAEIPHRHHGADLGFLDPLDHRAFLRRTSRRAGSGCCSMC